MAQKYVPQRFTLNDYLDEHYFKYLEDTVKDPSRFTQLLTDWIRSPVLLRAQEGVNQFVNENSLGRGIKLSTKWTAGLIAGAFILGPGVELVNSLTHVPVDPIDQFAVKISYTQLGWLGEKIQRFIIAHDAQSGENGSQDDDAPDDTLDQKDVVKISKTIADIKAVRKELEKTTSALEKQDFDSLSPADRTQTWNQFQNQFYSLNLRMNQTIQPNLEQGRILFQQWLLHEPLAYANNIASSDAQLELHKQGLETLQASLAQRKTPPTLAEKARIQEHEQKMEFAKHTIAENMAAIILYKLAFPEVNTATNLALNNSFTTMTKYIGFNLFAKEFASDIRQALQAIDPQLEILQKMLDAQATQKKPGAK